MIKMAKKTNIKPTPIDFELTRERDVEEEVRRLF